MSFTLDLTHVMYGLAVAITLTFIAGCVFCGTNGRPKLSVVLGVGIIVEIGLLVTTAIFSGVYRIQEKTAQAAALCPAEWGQLRDFLAKEESTTRELEGMQSFKNKFTCSKSTTTGQCTYTGSCAAGCSASGNIPLIPREGAKIMRGNLTSLNQNRVVFDELFGTFIEEPEKPTYEWDD